jgi:hypothetical protein
MSVCQHCHFDVPQGRTNCPHCAQPQIFPNVEAAGDQVELEKLAARYSATEAECQRTGSSAEFTQFMQAAATAHAIMALHLERLHWQIASEKEIFATYHDLEKLRLRTSAAHSVNWGIVRPQAEIELLRTHFHPDKLHYACLSLDWTFLPHYGNTGMRLNDGMIAHRATCFEGNSAVAFLNEHTLNNRLRSQWSDRGRIAAATRASLLKAGTPAVDFARILLSPETTGEADDFIEVHVFGDMTARTFSEVMLPPDPLPRDQAIYRDAIEEKLLAANVTISHNHQ